MKKIYLFLAVLCFAVSMQAADYTLYIAGTQVTDLNCSDILGDGKVSYDPATNTLVLNSANIQAEGECGILTVNALNILVRGTSQINVIHPGSGIACISVMGKLKIYSDDSYRQAILYVHTGTEAHLPINTYSDLEVSGFMILRLAGWNENIGNIYAQNVLINGATVEFSNGDNVGCAGSITIQDSEISSPTGCKLSADAKRFVNADDTALENYTKVVVASKYRPLAIEISPSDKECAVVYHNDTDTTLTSKLLTQALYGKALSVEANAHAKYQFTGWYADNTDEDNLITNDKLFEFNIGKDDKYTFLVAKYIAKKVINNVWLKSINTDFIKVGLVWKDSYRSTLRESIEFYESDEPFHIPTYMVWLEQKQENGSYKTVLEGESITAGTYRVGLQLRIEDTKAEEYTFTDDASQLSVWVNNYKCNIDTVVVHEDYSYTSITLPEFTLDGTEGIDAISNDNSQNTNKLLIDGQLLIIKNGRTFNAIGTELTTDN